jgi:integrase/recombinase XerC/integrase/recombinase XerD
MIPETISQEKEAFMSMDIIEGQVREITYQPAPEAMAEDFLASLDVAESSKATYTRSLRQFIDWLDDTDRKSLQLAREDILAYKNYLKDRLSVYTVNQYLTAVRKLYQWLESKKIYPDITRGISGIQKPDGFRKDTLTPEQLREALDAMDTDRLTGMRDYALFNLMARTGLRDIEVSRALVEDIRQEAGEAVLYIQGKGRSAKDKFVVLMPETEKPIRDYLQARGKVDKTEPLFISHSDRNRGDGLTTRSISRIIKKAFRRIGLDDERITAHSLRHTAITLSIKGGASLHQAQAMARHKSPETTMVYFHNLKRIEEAAERHINF